MHTTIRTLALCALLAGSAGALAAETSSAPADPAAPLAPGAPPHHRMSPAEHTERMTRELQLSPQQAEAVGEINERFATEMRALRDSPGERSERRAAVHELFEKHAAELARVLDEQQYAKWEAKRREMLERRRARKGNQPPPGAPADDPAPSAG